MENSICNINRQWFYFILVALSVYVEQCLALQAVNASDCFWTLNVNENPSCSFQMSTEADDVGIQCLRPGVLQVSGDFRVFYINCTASYPLDFKFDGPKPTEAIHVHAWGQVEKNSKGKFKLFHLDIKVLSISSLYDYYSNLFPNTPFTHKDSYNYSRTGNYIFSGYHEREGFESKFYIFFEEKWAKKTFIRNETVTFVVPTSRTTEAFRESKLTVPCRPSYFHDIVTLDQTGNRKAIEFTYDASIGFTSTHSWNSIVEDEPQFWLNQKLTFTCFLGSNENPDDFLEFPAKDPDTPYGFEDLPKLNNNANEVFRLYNVEILANGSMSTRRTCTFDINGAVHDEDRGILIYLGVDNPIMYRLQYHFVLPKFATRSYLADKLNVTLLNGSIDLTLPSLKGTTSLVENSFCMAKNNYLVSTVTIGVSGRYESIIYGSDFSKGKVEYETSFHLKISRDPPSSAEMYVNQKITFRCYIHAFYYIRPAIWYTERANGTVVEEIIDYNWKNSFFSYATIKLPKDVQSVVCAAAIWHSSDWRNISMKIDLHDSQEPSFEDGPTTAVIHFPLHSVNQNLKCTATGIPRPFVYWQRNEKNVLSSSISINTISSSEYSLILEFPSVKQEDEGEYICIASNVANTRKKVFTVSVFTESGYGLSIVIPIAVLICGIVATSTWVYVKYYRLEKTGLTKKEIDNFINGECVPEACELKPMNCNRNASEYAHENTHLSPYNNAYEIAQNRYEIDTTKVLGSGAYGMVLLGSLDGGPVAIKTVKRNADKSYLKALLSELKVMIFLGAHENIVGILGASTVNLSSGELFIFVPYCGLGNLENYLRSNRQLYISDQDGYVNTRGNTTDTADQYVNDRSVDYITLNNLYEWSIQIAEGMKYLGAKKVIHGDLAARNILLSNERIAKITDFGLSRQLYNYSEYAKKQQAPLPWRYMALESLRDLRFSTKSDVWSYGILLWEIFSLAQTPYAGYSWTMGFVNELENGLCLMRPPLASDNLYNNIMKKCWHSDPQSRPTFGQIQEHLTTHNIS